MRWAQCGVVHLLLLIEKLIFSVTRTHTNLGYSHIGNYGFSRNGTKLTDLDSRERETERIKLDSNQT